MCLCPRSGAQTGGGGWERQHRGHRLSIGHPPGTCSQPRRYQCSAFLKHISSRTLLLPSSLARATGTTATAEVKETVHDRCLAHDECEDGMCQLILSVSTTEPDMIGFDSTGQCVCVYVCTPTFHRIWFCLMSHLQYIRAPPTAGLPVCWWIVSCSNSTTRSVLSTHAYT